MKRQGSSYGLLFSTVAVCALTAFGASAQEIAGGSVLNEVVVTASRQSNTVNKSALSITAVTQEAIEHQGLKRVDDLTRIAPALTIRRSIDTSNNIALRGIVTAAGSATTGVYLDDTPLQKRVSIGAAQGNGAPTPFLYDLERVEVLRGPQGTLYGGSSLGGTIRFITPTPSLTTQSTTMRAEGSTTKGGDPSYEVGFATGGPLVEDKLGFRGSAFVKRQGGYIEHMSPYTLKRFNDNSNDEEGFSMRAALLWQATDKLQIMPTLYYATQKLGDTDFYNLDVPQYTTAAIVTPNTGTGFPSYTYAPHTYGPIATGKFTNLLPGNYYRDNKVVLPVLNIAYDFGNGFALKSITSFLDEQADGTKQGAYDQPGNRLGGTGLVAELPNHAQTFAYTNDRESITQEIRLSLAPSSDRRLSFVIGGFYQHAFTSADYKIYEDLDEVARTINGAPATIIYRSGTLPGGISGNRYQKLNELELAVFGEANYRITDKLKVTGGLRKSDSTFGFDGFFIGPIVGNNVKSLAAGTATNGRIKDKPLTYKVGADYQITDRSMVYGNVSKGFRTGGVNTTQQSVGCDAALAAYGGTIPSTYGPDTVIAYEAGSKSRLFERVQVNASAFKINWRDIQTNVPLPGCFTFVGNSGKAVSKGFDLQIQAQPTDNLSLNVALGYDKAEFTETLFGPVSAINGSRALLISKGDQLPVPPLTVAVGIQYDWTIGSLPAYIRSDYQYNKKYKRTYGPGTTTYNPDLYEGDDTTFVSARTGVKFGDIEASLFVDNLFDSDDAIDRAGGRTGCATAACTTASTNNRLQTAITFRPRTIGVSLSFRK